MPKAISVREAQGKPGQVYHPLQTVQLPDPSPKANEVVVRITAAALNHRDLFIRQSLYPGIGFGVPLCADGCGVVVSTGNDAAARAWRGKRVVLNPGVGWKEDADGPENPKGYAIMGGTKTNPLGTLGEVVVIDAGEVEEAPGHLSSLEAAALPLTGLTAWRAVAIKAGANCAPGKNVLVTGIGGGVAIMALLFAVARGANVFVTSGSEEKIRKAKEMGAKGGVSYKEKDWDKKLLAMLPKDRPKLDAIIDGAGGDIVEKGTKILKNGGVISSYGMTVGPKMPFLMSTVMRNIELRGSTMGSRKEFAEMVAFVNDKELRPIVSRVVSGIDNIAGIDSLFEDMQNASQFGKLCIEIAKDDAVKSML